MLLALILLGISTHLQASDYSDDVNELIEYMKSVTKNATMKKGNRSAGDNRSDSSCVKEVRDLENVKEDEDESLKKDDEILVFVSFSMPEASLKQLSDESGKYHARLIMRGIYKNSFKDLKEKVLSISKDGLKFDIDPELFKKYDIKQVPTFVNTKTGNKLSGNVTLEFAIGKLHFTKPVI